MGSGSHFVVKCLSSPGIELPLAMEIFQQPVFSSFEWFQEQTSVFSTSKLVFDVTLKLI